MIIPDLPFEQYQAISAVSNTALGKLAKAPAFYRQWLASHEEDESDALRIGRVAHRAILEPEKFKEEFAAKYAVKPDGMKFSTKEGKAWKAEQEAAGREIVEHEAHLFLHAAALEIGNHPVASAMLREGRPELTVTAELDGVPVKCRVDFATDGNSLVDLKTTRDASPRGFQKMISERAYYRQAAFYLDVCKAAGMPRDFFSFLAIEKEPPYLMGCYVLCDESIAIGRKEYKRLLALWSQCNKVDDWPGYDPALQTISLPMWRLNQEAA